MKRSSPRAASRTRYLIGSVLTVSLLAGLALFRDEPSRAVRPSMAEATATQVQPTESLNGIEWVRHESPARETVAVAAPEAGRTILTVAVVDVAGRPVRAGRIECRWSADPQIEIGGAQGVLETAIRGAETRIALSPEALEAMITAVPDVGEPARVVLRRLRYDGRAWAAPGDVFEHSVVVRIGAAPGTFLRGRVRVDGASALPAGLQIVLEQDLDETLEALDPESPGRAVALLDTRDASYRVGPLARRVDGLLVTSTETVATWVPLLPRRSDSEERRVDVELTRGRRLVLEAVDASGTALGGLDLAITLQQTLHLEDTIQDLVDRRRVRTDGSGTAVVQGLPGTTRVSVGLAERSHGALVFDLGPEGGDEVRRRIVVEDADLVTGGFVWGPPVHAAMFPGASDDELSVWVARCAGVRSSSLAETGPSGWGHRGEPGRVAIWAESHGRRVSAVTELDLEEGRSIGPIALAPLLLETFECRWTGAPPGLHLALRRPSGERLAEAELERDRGRLTFEAEACQRVVAVLGEGDAIAAVRELATVDGRIDLDLSALRPRRVTLTLAGQTLAGPWRVAFVALEGADAAVECAAGTEARSHLEAGRYAWFASGAGAGLVAGLCAIGEHDRDVALAWSGAHVREDALAPASAVAVVVEAIDGRDLTGAVPAVMRTLVLSPAGDGRAREVLFAPDSYVWRSSEDLPFPETDS